MSEGSRFYANLDANFNLFFIRRMRRLRALAMQIVLLLVVRLAAAQCIVTIGGPISVGGSPATSQQFVSPFGVASDGSGGWYISDTAGQVLRRALANGTMSVVLGTPLRAATVPLLGEGGPGTSTFLLSPYNLGSDGAGGVFVADQGQHIIRRLCANGTSLRVAGNTTSGSSGDGGLAIYARLNFSAGVAGDPSGGVWIADSGK